MSNFGMLSLSLSLAADAFFASFTINIKNPKYKELLFLLPAFSFGAFQMFMPILGFRVGETFLKSIKQYGAPLSFVILFVIGLNMIMDKVSDTKKESSINKFGFFYVLTLSVATSLDALIVGTTFSFLNINVLKPSLVIGIVTFILCAIGESLGEKLKDKNEKLFGILAGGVLIILAFKILLKYLNLI